MEMERVKLLMLMASVVLILIFSKGRCVMDSLLSGGFRLSCCKY